MFVKKLEYYGEEVYEWNLPTGWSCPFASECLVKVDREARFPGVNFCLLDNYYQPES